jgi:CheY-like chemotaxis protein
MSRELNNKHNKRILIIDDNLEIWETYRAIFSLKQETIDSPDQKMGRLLDEETELEPVARAEFQLRFASQGEEGFDLVQESITQNMPFAVVFIDMRMPPGWDGLKTATMIRRIDSNIEIVIVTAYSDHSQVEIIRAVGTPDKLLFLRKPFDPEEIAQMALSLAEKWNLARQEEFQRDELKRLVESLQDAYDKISLLVQEVITNQKMNLVFENPDLEKCYEKKNCDQEDCPCYGKESMRCWQVAGTFCGGEAQGVFAQKYINCNMCDVYLDATSNPVNMIGEHFNNMMYILEIKHRELQDALLEIKTLRGIVPICSNCKKIRDDKGFWSQVEVYVRAHTHAEFTHGICPECAKKLYPELELDSDDD